MPSLLPIADTPTAVMALPAGPAAAADSQRQHLRHLRQQCRISQMQLALRVGVSQRHLSCIETGRARASRAMLHALLDALDAPLHQRNQALLAAGYAPAFAQRTLADAEMAPVRAALAHLLAAHDPAPAFVLDDGWNLLQANRGTHALMGLLGVPAAALVGPGAGAGAGAGLNLLRALLGPGGLGRAIVNADAVCAEVWQRAQREAVHSAALRAIVDELRPQLPRRLAAALPLRPAAPLLETQLRCTDGGVLRFFSAFTTFGAPLDVTAASLRVEHFFPADEATRLRLVAAVAALPAPP